jgi:hypothetical protein
MLGIMCASTPTPARNWKRIFLIAETLVIVELFYWFALQIAWRYDVSEHPHFMAACRILFPVLMPVLYSFLATSVFLLLASPFFLRSLRSVAVRAWIVGAGALLYAGYLCFALR